MGANHNNASDTSEPDQFSSLCGLTSFATNSKRVLKIRWKLTPAEDSVLCSLLLTPGISISQLTLTYELPPNIAAQLKNVINHSTTIRAITLGYYINLGEAKPIPELFRTLSIGASSTLEQLSINSFPITSDWLACYQFEKFTSPCSLTIKMVRDWYCSIPLLVTRIGQLRTLESLRIWHVPIGDSNIEILAATLRDRLPLLAELEICGGSLSEKAGRPIGSLVALGRIKKLALGYNELKDEGVSAIIDAILSSSRMHNCKLQHLDLRMTSIRLAGGIKLAELIAHSSHLRVLELSRNVICKAADAFCKSIQLRSHTLEELDVSECYMGSRGALPLLDALRAFTALKVLRTGRCYEGYPAAHALAQLLMFSGGCRLIELQIICSDITETGALELAGALAKVYTLRSINTCEDRFGPRGGVAIIDALATASANPMDAINFGDCRIGDDGASAVGRLIRRRGCRKMHLYLNEIQTTGAKAIMDSAAVSTTCMINLLDLAHNPIGDEGVRYALDKMMQSQRRLVHRLSIRGIKMGAKAATAIKRAVEEHDIQCWMDVDKYHNNDWEAVDILEEVEKWEHDSKPSRDPILRLS